MADTEEPLDPKVEAVRRKLVRLLVVSGGIMALGFAALIIAVVYRLNAGDDIVVAGNVDLVLPEGAEIVDTAIGSSRLAVTMRLPDGRREIRVFDTSGRLVVTYTLK